MRTKIVVSLLFAVITSVSLAQSLEPLGGKWAVTSDLPLARWDHSAIPLKDGRVLVAGGIAERVSATADCRLYDPATGTWTATGSLNIARSTRLAVRLNDGRVLIAKGSPGDTAELYDPVTGKWTDTGSLTHSLGDALTLLQDGRVLMTGGFSQIYEPETGKWSLTAPAQVERIHHTATLLADGKVLVAGGWHPNGDTLSSAELYDPAANTWVYTGSLSRTRSNDVAALLPDGTVLVAGGAEDTAAEHYSTKCELYDPSTGTWGLTDKIPTPRWEQQQAFCPTARWQ